MEKVFHFDSPAEKYHADACVITCFDARFDQAVRKFLKRQGIVVYDQVKIPGASKPWAAAELDGDGDFLLRAVRTSISLHAPKKVLLIGHNDCGAYAGAPTDVIAADVARAAAFLTKTEPSIAVEAYLADFDGIYRVD